MSKGASVSQDLENCLDEDASIWSRTDHIFSRRLTLNWSSPLALADGIWSWLYLVIVGFKMIILLVWRSLGQALHQIAQYLGNDYYEKLQPMINTIFYRVKKVVYLCLFLGGQLLHVAFVFSTFVMLFESAQGSANEDQFTSIYMKVIFCELAVSAVMVPVTLCLYAMNGRGHPDFSTFVEDFIAVSDEDFLGSQLIILWARGFTAVATLLITGGSFMLLCYYGLLLIFKGSQYFPFF